MLFIIYRGSHASAFWCATIASSLRISVHTNAHWCASIQHIGPTVHCLSTCGSSHRIHILRAKVPLFTIPESTSRIQRNENEWKKAEIILFERSSRAPHNASQSHIDGRVSERENIKLCFLRLLSFWENKNDDGRRIVNEIIFRSKTVIMCQTDLFLLNVEINK